MEIERRAAVRYGQLEDALGARVPTEATAGTLDAEARARDRLVRVRVDDEAFHPGPGERHVTNLADAGGERATDVAEADDPEEEQEIDFSGCEGIASGGYHSDHYGDDGDGACIWCGARPGDPPYNPCPPLKSPPEDR